MNLKATLFGIFSISLFSLGVWIVILFNIDPWQTDLLTHIAFIASLFLWLAGLVTFAEFYGRIYIGKKEIIFAHLTPSIRHGLLSSLAISILMTLQWLRVLNIFEAALVVILIAVSELFFRTRARHA